MKGISVVFYDINTKTFVDSESLHNGELIIDPHADELADILLKVDNIFLDDDLYIIESRCFNLDKMKLIIKVKQNTKRYPTP